MNGLQKAECEGIANRLCDKSQAKKRKFIESMKPGEPGPAPEFAQEIDMAQTLHYMGLVRPVKASESWIPCKLTEAGEAVLVNLKGGAQ